jgi:hypothetical protein
VATSASSAAIRIPKPTTPAAPAAVAHFAPTEPARAAVPQPEGVPTDGGMPPPSKRRNNQRPTLEVDPGAIHGVAAGGTSIDMDLDALERAAAEAQTPFYQQIQDLPPPPATVLGNKRSASGGGYSVRSAPQPPGSSRTPAAPTVTRAPTPPVRPGAPSPGRYAPSRPASIFATTRPQEGASIFGEDLISEKSLDEVILSYLAEDLDGPVDKK